MNYRAPPIPAAFIWRRAHSFTGLWLVLFLIQHLLTNSLSVMMLGEYGKGFISSVNSIKSLPYLSFIELGLLGVPFAIHGIWGIKYLLTGKSNSFRSDGSNPSLSQFSRNHAYTWQRITSWILLIGIMAHVVHMRFLEYPDLIQRADQEYYILKLNKNTSLMSFAYRWNIQMMDSEQAKKELVAISDYETDALKGIKNEQDRIWNKTIESQLPQEGQVLVFAKSFGIATLLMLVQTFKQPIMVLLYTGLVLAACFHAFNGLWTLMISWGITLTERSQAIMRSVATTLMVIVTFWGLVAIWGIYLFY